MGDGKQAPETPPEDSDQCVESDQSPFPPTQYRTLDEEGVNNIPELPLLSKLPLEDMEPFVTVTSSNMQYESV